MKFNQNFTNIDIYYQQHFDFFLFDYYSYLETDKFTFGFITGAFTTF
jgi:hypothetical protein